MQLTLSSFRPFHLFGATVLSLAFASTLISAPSFASGSEGFGGASTGAAKSYNLGKRVLVKKVLCKTCVLAGQKIKKEDAKLLLQGKGNAEKIQAVLNAEEQSALAVYLKRRYKL